MKKEKKEKVSIFKKMFGCIDLTWKKLIIFAVVAAIYTAVMALIPQTADTSFRDIAVQFEWWILMGIIIIANCKSPKESALKCFVFFLISQPLIYLIQVPFNPMGFGLFRYYKYWFIWTLLTIPMGFIGYYINKKNWLSVVILLPMLLLLVYLGLGYLDAVVDNFPHHLLSCISCFGIILIVVLCLFDELKHKLVSLGVTLLAVLCLIFVRGGFANGEFEAYKDLDDFVDNITGKIYVSTFTTTGRGEVLVTNEDEHNVKLLGRKKEIYEFTVTDENSNEYSFKYYFDKSNNVVVFEYLNDSEEEEVVDEE